MGSRSTVVLCTVTVPDFCFPCHPWYNRMKEVYTEGSLWKNESGRELVRKFQDNETWAAGCFELHACTIFTSIERHHVGALKEERAILLTTTPWKHRSWLDNSPKEEARKKVEEGCHSPHRLYSPRLLIIRWPKSGTAKTVPAVPAAPALNPNEVHSSY